MMAYLADEGIVRIPIGEAVDVTLPGLPIRFQSDISYVVLKDRKISADEEDEDIDDDFEDDTEEEP